jgi:hypothetical protein
MSAVATLSVMRLPVTATGRMLSTDERLGQRTQKRENHPPWRSPQPLGNPLIHCSSSTHVSAVVSPAVMGRDDAASASPRAAEVPTAREIPSLGQRIRPRCLMLAMARIWHFYGEIRTISRKSDQVFM